MHVAPAFPAVQAVCTAAVLPGGWVRGSGLARSLGAAQMFQARAPVRPAWGRDAAAGLRAVEGGWGQSCERLLFLR